MVTAFVVVPAGSSAVATPGNRTESVVTTTSPITGVVESVVRVRVPLPASVGAHPAACDWLSYLRYRDRFGPTSSALADKVFVAQPGILEGAGAFDSVARTTVATAAAAGKHVEFWALDRRSNCLEDLTGIQAGVAAKDFHVAVDYYYRHRPVGGRTFAGFLTDDQVAWLASTGLEQTIRDEYDLLTAELPNQQIRRQKVLCGGHSLGGVLTGFFAAWDFDGNPATTSDGGYNQCAGYFALDTTITTSLADLSGRAPGTVSADEYDRTQTMLRLGLTPRTLSGPVLINPETMNLMAVAGVAADTRPEAESDLLRYLPSNVNIAATTRLLFSKDVATYLLGTPSASDFRLTNQAALGALFDDNSQPLAFLQTSVGLFDGGALARKQYPLPKELTSLPPLAGVFGKEMLAAPDVPHGPLYTWRNYDRIGAPGTPVHRDPTGKPFTTPADEVTDISELARSLSEHPLDFTEKYFPAKLMSDISQATAPQIARWVLHPGGLKARPTLTVIAERGLFADRPDVVPTLGAVLAPGYQHLDVLTAAPAQNTGKPEIVSTSLVAFTASV